MEWDITPDVQFWIKIFQLGYTNAYRVRTKFSAHTTMRHIPHRLYRRAPPSAPQALPECSPRPPNPILPSGYLPNAPIVRHESRQQKCHTRTAMTTATPRKLSRTYSITPQLTWHTPWAADFKYLGAYTTYYYSLYNDYDNTGISSYVFPVIPGTGACAVPGVGVFDCPPLTVNPRNLFALLRNQEILQQRNQYHFAQRFAAAMDLRSIPVQRAELLRLPGICTSRTKHSSRRLSSSALPLRHCGRAESKQRDYLHQQEMHDNSYAAFAQTDWNFTPTWKLTTGLRYTYDILKGGEQFRELCFGLPVVLAIFSARFRRPTYWARLRL